MLPARRLHALAVADIDEDVHRPEQLTGRIMDGVGVGQDGEPLTVRAFDHDLMPVIGFVLVRAKAIQHWSWAI